jgi:hypothetical protein
VVDLEQLVEAKLKEADSPEAIDLWHEIWTRFEDGGPDAVEAELLKRLKQVKSAATREIKETKQVVPRKARRRRRQR